MPKLFRSTVPLASTQGETTHGQSTAPAPLLCSKVQWVAVCILAIGLAAFLGLLLAFGTSTPLAALPPQPPLSPPPSDPVTIMAPPHNGTEITRLVHGSCANQRKQQHFWNAMRARDPQLFLFNGDIVYGDCKGAQCPELTEAWDNFFANPNLRAAAATLPMVGESHGPQCALPLLLPVSTRGRMGGVAQAC